jgi:hypothetical protein
MEEIGKQESIVQDSTLDTERGGESRGLPPGGRVLGHFKGPGPFVPTTEPPEVEGRMDVSGSLIFVRVKRLSQSAQRASGTRERGPSSR